MSQPVESAMFALRKYMFASVYTNPVAKGQESKAEQMIEMLYAYYRTHLDFLPEEYLRLAEQRGESADRIVADYIAGMTDKYAVSRVSDIMIPKAWGVY